MGGHLCLRAAALEPRIKHVITSGGAVDYWKIPGPLSRSLLKIFMHYKNFTTRALRKKMRKDEYHNWFAENSMYITKIANQFHASMKMMDMNIHNSQPHKITQDVLILSGKNDHFIPIKMHNKMIKALSHAHSIKGIIYTKETNAQNHCQIGNIPLLCMNIIDWLDTL